MLWYSNIQNRRNFGVFESETVVGDFYRKEMAVEYDGKGVAELLSVEKYAKNA